MRREHLDGDASLEARIARFIDLAHSACAEHFAELVRTEEGAILGTFQYKSPEQLGADEADA